MRTVFCGAILILILGLLGPDSSSFAETRVQVTDKKTIAENQTGTEQPDQKTAAGEDVKENLEDKSENGSIPTGVKHPRKATATAGPKEVKGVDAKKSSKGDADIKKTIPTAEDDRPWLMKERSNKKPDTPPKKPVPLKWKNEEQQLHCKTQLKELQKTLGKARTYSIRGDTCATAKHAHDFLALTGRLKAECPDGFLESNGYSEKIIENLKVLSELGKKACLEK
ncbi:MAG: hypothetical protein K9N10_06480 [Deltaproteobacteria bacterium]|nr:hypothetical protein [Deltaproteobacteria bacterium]